MNIQHQTVATAHGDHHLVERSRALATLVFEAAESADARAEISAETWSLLRASGLLAAPFPPRLGGEDLTSPGRHAVLAEVLRLIGWGDLSVGRLFEGHVNAVALVRRYGTNEQIARLADAVASGAISAVWGAEDSVGLRVERHQGAWRLDGRKILASGAGLVTHPVVTARRGDAQVLILPVLRPGERTDLSGWTAQGMRSSATGTVELSGLSLADDGILGEDGDFMRQPQFSGGAWRFCAVHLGATERLVDLYREHLHARGRADDPYQVQRVALCAVAAGTGRFWVEAAAERAADESEDSEQVVAFVNMTRMVVERAALDVMEMVHRGVGLAAFVRPHPIERISRDLATYLRQPVIDLAMADAGRAVLARDAPTGRLWDRTA